MGINYYAIQKLQDSILKESGNTNQITTLEEWIEEQKGKDYIHIGKSSAGWKFTFNTNEWRYYTNIDELKEWLKSHLIVSEYGDVISFEDFWKKVESKQNTQEHEGENYVIVQGYDFLLARVFQ